MRHACISKIYYWTSKIYYWISYSIFCSIGRLLFNKVFSFVVCAYISIQIFAGFRFFFASYNILMELVGALSITFNYNIISVTVNKPTVTKTLIPRCFAIWIAKVPIPCKIEGTESSGIKLEKTKRFTLILCQEQQLRAPFTDSYL